MEIVDLVCIRKSSALTINQSCKHAAILKFVTQIFQTRPLNTYDDHCFQCDHAYLILSCRLIELASSGVVLDGKVANDIAKTIVKTVDGLLSERNSEAWDDLRDVGRRTAYVHRIRPRKNGETYSYFRILRITEK